MPASPTANWLTLHSLISKAGLPLLPWGCCWSPTRSLLGGVVTLSVFSLTAALVTHCCITSGPSTYECKPTQNNMSLFPHSFCGSGTCEWIISLPVQDLLQSCHLVSAGTTVIPRWTWMGFASTFCLRPLTECILSPVAYGRPVLGSLSGPCLSVLVQLAS